VSSPDDRLVTHLRKRTLAKASPTLMSALLGIPEPVPEPDWTTAGFDNPEDYAAWVERVRAVQRGEF
jgi:hypothetical protein